MSRRNQAKPNPQAYRYELLGHAKEIIATDDMQHRLLYCSSKPAENASTAKIVRHGDKVHVTDIHVCENPWICPVCAARIGQQRAAEIRGIMARLRDHVVVMVTYTARHDRNMTLDQFANAFKQAIRFCKSGRAWQNVKKAHKIAHAIKSEEVTHGGNGWHYHAHELLFLEWDGQDTYEVSDIQSAVQDRWLSALDKFGLSALGKIGCDVTMARDKVAEYINKIADVLPDGKDVASELGRHDTKRGFENRSIMQLLHDASLNDDLGARFRWLEFVKWCRGKHRVSFSTSLKDIRAELELEGEQSENAAIEEIVCELTDVDLSVIWKTRSFPRLIAAAQISTEYGQAWFADFRKRYKIVSVDLSLLD